MGFSKPICAYMDNDVRVIHEIATGKILVMDDATGTADYRADLYEENIVLDQHLPALLAYGVDEIDLNKKSQQINTNMTPAEFVFIKDMTFGRTFISKLLDRLKNTESLTNAQRLTLLNTIKDAMNTLLWGDIAVSRAAFNAVATTVLFTQARKDWILAQLDEYLSG